MKLVLNNIWKSYNDISVIKGINLNLINYKSIGIIGKSGCGKSTLLRLISGIEQPDKGEIIVDNVVLSKKNIKKYQKTIGMIFQQHSLFPHLSLLENISLILEKVHDFNKEEAEKISKKLLNQLHLSNEMHKIPNDVSGGQAQRASIARALATNPKMIIMDEPTAALDPLLTREVLEAVLELRDLGKVFIFVTHEIDFVKNFADYIIFMDEGKIVEMGEPSILINPKSTRLKQFLEYEKL